MPSNAVLPSTPSKLPAIFHMALSLCASMLSRVRRISPVAEAYASKQPRLPQVHCHPPRSMTMCPISAPAERFPSNSLPSKMIPPPTPVPSVIKTIEPNFLPAPQKCSPSAAAFASLVMQTGTPNCSRTAPHSGTFSQRILLLYTMTPFSASISPGEPMPTPASCPSARPARAARSLTSRAMSAAISV